MSSDNIIYLLTCKGRCIQEMTVVHGVNIMVLILVISVTILISHIMKYAYEEMNDAKTD